MEWKPDYERVHITLTRVAEVTKRFDLAWFHLPGRDRRQS